MASKIKAIINAQLVLETGILWDAILLIEKGKILTYGDKSELSIPEDAEIIDAHGAYVGPGFVDIHVHAGGQYSTATEPISAAKECLKHGATSILATPSYTMNFEELIKSIGIIKAAMPDAKTIKGIYSEGPYINPNYGAFSHINPWRHPLYEGEYKRMVDEAGKYVRVWTVAPEYPNVLEFMKYARSVNPDVIFSLGHSEALPSEIKALGKYRPSILTHATDATGRRPVPAGTRSVGPDEYCINESSMYAELISDSKTMHVAADMQRLLLKTKGIEKIILITDATTSKITKDPALERFTDLNFDDNGDLAGSRLTMNQACRNIMKSTNAGIAQAFMMASTNPARALGMDDDIGSIEAGKTADLVFVDDKFNVERVILGGEICIFD